MWNRLSLIVVIMMLANLSLAEETRQRRNDTPTASEISEMERNSPDKSAFQKIKEMWQKRAYIGEFMDSIIAERNAQPWIDMDEAKAWSVRFEEIPADSKVVMIEFFKHKDALKVVRGNVRKPVLIVKIASSPYYGNGRRKEEGAQEDFTLIYKNALKLYAPGSPGYYSVDGLEGDWRLCDVRGELNDPSQPLEMTGTCYIEGTLILPRDSQMEVYNRRDTKRTNLAANAPFVEGSVESLAQDYGPNAEQVSF